MARVISVSVPDKLYARWEESGKEISPSALFQMALETELGSKNQLLTYWSNRALTAEKRIEATARLLGAPEKEIKKFLFFENNRES